MENVELRIKRTNRLCRIDLNQNRFAVLHLQFSIFHSQFSIEKASDQDYNSKKGFQ